LFDELALTRCQLAVCITILKNALSTFDAQQHKKVVYLNDRCLYRHARRFVYHGGEGEPTCTIGELVDLIEPYIPFKLTEENFDLLMDAVNEPEIELPLDFSHKAKQDFIANLRNVKKPAEWYNIMAVCESIRAMKEKYFKDDVLSETHTLS
jgi:hypothetical protein